MREQSFWLRERTGRNPYLFDGLLGIGLGGAVLALFLAADTSGRFPNDADPLGAALVVAAWVPVVFRRRAPVAAAIASGGAVLAHTVLGYPESLVPVAAMITLGTVAAHRDRRTSLAATGVALACNLVSLAAIDDLTLGSVVFGAMLIGGIVALGDRRQVRAAYLEQLELRAAGKVRERIEAAERAVNAERARIARELHDVVAHAMSVVAVQSGVGAHVIDDDPASAKRMLETISDTSRDALAEMRRLLGVLRDGSGDDGDEPDLSPAPGLAGLGDLVDRFIDAGVPVALTVSGDRSTLAPGVDLAAYRIVQEALTNVLKHAGRARASVEVHCGREELRLVIADDGRGPVPGATTGAPARATAGTGTATGAGRTAGPGTTIAATTGAGGTEGAGTTTGPGPVAGVAAGPPGHGIVGMRERAELYGGELAVGPRPGGGFLVVAVLRPTPSAAAA